MASPGDAGDGNAEAVVVPRTRSPSDGGQVRWYFSHEPLRPHEPAAARPETGVVAPGEFLRFSARDSAALEQHYLKGEEEFLRQWWKEYAESTMLAPGPRPVTVREAPSTAGASRTSSATSRASRGSAITLPAPPSPCRSTDLAEGSSAAVARDPRCQSRARRVAGPCLAGTPDPAEGPALRASAQNGAVEEAGEEEDGGMDDAVGPTSLGDGTESAKAREEEEDSVGVPVKGGLYEVILSHRRSVPVYWEGEERRVLRGLWYAKRPGLAPWLPLREDLSEQLETAYHAKVWRRKWFQPSGLYAARVHLVGVIEGLSALFTGEDDTWQAQLSVYSSSSSSSSRTFFTFTPLHGMQLRRGFDPASLDMLPNSKADEQQRKEEALDDYCCQVPVEHVLFMVHGIGQRMQSAHLVEDVTAFRRNALSMAEAHLSQSQRAHHRCLFIPCQWRRGLRLGGEAVVEDITLDGIRTLRETVSATVHDVLFYMSPVYRQDIVLSLTASLNRLFRKFLRRNPGFQGKVSVYGHSLGSVLLFDILCHQPIPRGAAAAPALAAPDGGMAQAALGSQVAGAGASCSATCNGAQEHKKSQVAGAALEQGTKEQDSGTADGQNHGALGEAQGSKDRAKELEVAAARERGSSQCARAAGAARPQSLKRARSGRVFPVGSAEPGEAGTPSALSLTNRASTGQEEVPERKAASGTGEGPGKQEQADIPQSAGSPVAVHGIGELPMSGVTQQPPSISADVLGGRRLLERGPDVGPCTPNSKEGSGKGNEDASQGTLKVSTGSGGKQEATSGTPSRGFPALWDLVPLASLSWGTASPAPVATPATPQSPVPGEVGADDRRIASPEGAALRRDGSLADEKEPESSQGQAEPAAGSTRPQSGADQQGEAESEGGQRMEAGSRDKGSSLVGLWDRLVMLGSSSAGSPPMPAQEEPSPLHSPAFAELGPTHAGVPPQGELRLEQWSVVSSSGASSPLARTRQPDAGNGASYIAPSPEEPMESPEMSQLRPSLSDSAAELAALSQDHDPFLESQDKQLPFLPMPPAVARSTWPSLPPLAPTASQGLLQGVTGLGGDASEGEAWFGTEGQDLMEVAGAEQVDASPVRCGSASATAAWSRVRAVQREREKRRLMKSLSSLSPSASPSSNPSFASGSSTPPGHGQQRAAEAPAAVCTGSACYPAGEVLPPEKSPSSSDGSAACSPKGAPRVLLPDLASHVQEIVGGSGGASARETASWRAQCSCQGSPEASLVGQRAHMDTFEDNTTLLGGLGPDVSPTASPRGKGAGSGLQGSAGDTRTECSRNEEDDTPCGSEPSAPALECWPRAAQSISAIGERVGEGVCSKAWGNELVSAAERVHRNAGHDLGQASVQNEPASAELAGPGAGSARLGRSGVEPGEPGIPNKRVCLRVDGRAWHDQADASIEADSRQQEEEEARGREGGDALKATRGRVPQVQPESAQQASGARQQSEGADEPIHFAALDFEVDTFFAVGSPLGLFLALRNIRLGSGSAGKGLTAKETQSQLHPRLLADRGQGPGNDRLANGTEADAHWGILGAQEELPACRHLLNIFHPHDPVAYRLEPLAAPELARAPPVIVPFHRGGYRLHIGLKLWWQRVVRQVAQYKTQFWQASCIAARLLTCSCWAHRADPPGFAEEVEDEEAQAQQQLQEEWEGEGCEQEEEDGDGGRTLGHEGIQRKRRGHLPGGVVLSARSAAVMRRLTGSAKGRMDFVLQDPTFEHQYIQAISCHINSWLDPDIALLVIRHLYRGVPAQPLPTSANAKAHGGSLKNNAKPGPLAATLEAAEPAPAAPASFWRGLGLGLGLLSMPGFSVAPRHPHHVGSDAPSQIPFAPC